MTAAPLDQEPVFGPCARCRRVKELDPEGLCVECWDAQTDEIGDRVVQAVSYSDPIEQDLLWLERSEECKRQRRGGRLDAASRAAAAREKYWRDPAAARAKNREKRLRYRETINARARSTYRQLRGSRDRIPPNP